MSKKSGNIFVGLDNYYYINILRYSPNYTKEEGIESKDKEP